MTSFEQHLDIDQLGDFLDGLLLPEQRQVAEDHLAICTTCTERRDRLESLISASRALPDEIDPPIDLWTDVHERIQPMSARWRQRWILAAAAIVLVAASSAVTAILVRRPIIVRPVAVSTTIASNQLPASARSVDADYAAAIHDLNETLDENRAKLDPSTVAKVEASLHVIDGAIDEARRALAADPANLTLLDLLAANYERKLELLRRANALLPSI
ncbi:MAG TPA: zf-HC2 domain-containing protein [Gemmatimonadaceae bacterium]|jgi:anti-sigma factor RsiW